MVANGEIADAPASAGNLADLLSLDADDAAAASATASSAVTALQDLLSGDLSAEAAAAGDSSNLLLSCPLLSSCFRSYIGLEGITHTFVACS